jgi:DNA-directed RNA polymerase I subunit RPA1
VKGDVACAKNLEDAGIEKEDNDNTKGSSVKEDTTEATSGGNSSLEKDKKIWTSVQLKEVRSIFGKLIRKRLRKCTKCDMRSPTLSSPTFGWLFKVCMSLVLLSNRS